MKRYPQVLAVLVMLVLMAAAPLHAQTQTVIVVRHAEKVDDSTDPALNVDGMRRAEALAAALADAGVGAVFTTQFRRTRDTAAPLAHQLGLEPVVITTSGGNHAREVAARVREHAAGTVVVVGHSNTVPAIVEALGAPAVDAIADDEYFHLFIVQISPSGVRLIRSRY
jgi:broad specificity phosphatase PhoE